MKQLFNFYNSILKAQKFSEEEAGEIASFFVSNEMKDPQNLPENLRKINFSLSDLVYLGERLPTLNCECMHNFLSYLISQNRYEEIIAFLSKIFVSHIDKFNYVTEDVPRLTNLERTFDRFVECCLWAKIPFSEWQDAFFVALSANTGALSNWKRPARSYLKNKAKKDSDAFYDFVFKNFSKYGMTIFSVLFEENISSAIPKLLNYWLYNEFEEKRQVKNILKQHFEDVYSYVEELKKESKITAVDFVNVLLIYVHIPKVVKLLSEIYEKEKDKEIKKLIIDNAPIKPESKSINISQLKKNGSKFPQNFEILGKNISKYPKLCYQNEEDVSFEVVNYFVSCYKDLCSPKAMNELAGFKKLFTENSLDDFCFALAQNLASTNENEEFLYSLIAQNGSINCAKKAIQIFAKLSSPKKYKLFVKLFIFAQKEGALKLFNSLDKNKKEEKIVLDALLQGIIESNEYENDVVENLRDKMIPDFNILGDEIKIGGSVLKIMPDWSVAVLGEENITKEVQIEKKRLEREIERQSKRLESAFHSGRMWNKADWQKYIFENKLMRYFAKTLLWGRYSDGNLISVFKIEDEKISNIASISGLTNDYVIGIFHPVEYKELDWHYNFDSKRAPFNQLDVGVHILADYNIHSFVVSRFNGFMVNSKTFFERMQSLGWKFGVMSVDKKVQEMVKLSRDLKVLANINFSLTPINSDQENIIMLGELRFYNTNEVLQTGNNFVLNKTKSKELSTLNPRYFSDIVYEITIAGKK